MAVAVIVSATYLIALVVAGHGAAPMAALLVMGDGESWWFAGSVLGWTALACLAAVTFVFRSTPGTMRTLQCVASIFLYLSWLWVAILGEGESGSFWGAFLLSAPFQLACAFVVYRAVRQEFSSA